MENIRYVTRELVEDALSSDAQHRSWSDLQPGDLIAIPAVGGTWKLLERHIDTADVVRVSVSDPRDGTCDGTSAGNS